MGRYRRRIALALCAGCLGLLLLGCFTLPGPSEEPAEKAAFWCLGCHIEPGSRPPDTRPAEERPSFTCLGCHINEQGQSSSE